MDQECLKEFGNIIICGGSNNLSSAARRNDKKRTSEELDKVTRATRRIVRAGKGVGAKVLVALPPHRMDVPEDLTWHARDHLTAILIEEGGIPFRMENRENREQYLSRLADGIHFRPKHWREVLQRMLQKLDLDSHLREDKITLSEAFPGLCPKCGTCHPWGDHAQYERCYRCPEGNHPENVCLKRVLMCTGCGRRGHTQIDCNTYASRR